MRLGVRRQLAGSSGGGPPRLAFLRAGSSRSAGRSPCGSSASSCGCSRSKNFKAARGAPSPLALGWTASPPPPSAPPASGLTRMGARAPGGAGTVLLNGESAFRFINWWRSEAGGSSSLQLAQPRPPPPSGGRRPSSAVSTLTRHPRLRSRVSVRRARERSMPRRSTAAARRSLRGPDQSACG